MKLNLPLCYYPTSVVVIDDDPAWTKAFTREISAYLPAKAFNNPQEAIDYILSHTSHAISRIEGTIRNHEDFFAHEQVNNPDRFHDIGTIIIDYDMPQMNGLDACKQLQDIDVPIILLTGEADEKLAVDGFNQGLIQSYIQKSEPLVTDVAIKQAFQFQKALWQQRSQSIASVMANRDFHPLSTAFYNAECAKWILDKLEQLEVREYYFYSTPGNMMLVTEKGDIYWMAIASKAELDSEAEWIQDQYEDCENTQYRPLAEALIQKSKMLFFPKHHPQFAPKDFSEWTNFAHDCENLQTTTGEQYYLSIFPTNPVYDLPIPDLFSFDDYLG